jgi:hypothetical protein
MSAISLRTISTIVHAPTFRSSSTRRRIAAAALLGLPMALAPAAATQCLQAIFFDLGNTLVDQSVPSPYPLFPTAQAAIDGLQAAGLEVGIITNVPAGWTRDDLETLLLEPQFLDEFDVLVLSSQAPAAKPNPAIYSYAHGLLPAPLPAIGATAFVGETLSEIANSADLAASSTSSPCTVGDRRRDHL